MLLVSLFSPLVEPSYVVQSIGVYQPAYQSVNGVDEPITPNSSGGDGQGTNHGPPGSCVNEKSPFVPPSHSKGSPHPPGTGTCEGVGIPHCWCYNNSRCCFDTLGLIACCRKQQICTGAVQATSTPTPAGSGSNDGGGPADNGAEVPDGSGSGNQNGGTTIINPTASRAPKVENTLPKFLGFVLLCSAWCASM